MASCDSPVNPFIRFAHVHAICACSRVEIASNNEVIDEETLQDHVRSLEGIAQSQFRHLQRNPRVCISTRLITDGRWVESFGVTSCSRSTHLAERLMESSFSSLDIANRLTRERGFKRHRHPSPSEWSTHNEDYSRHRGTFARFGGIEIDPGACLYSAISTGYLPANFYRRLLAIHRVLFSSW